MRVATILLVMFSLIGAGFAFQSEGGVPKTASATKPESPSGTAKSSFSVYHAGPWEQKIGYAQAIRAGHTIYISGAVGADDKGFPKDLETQMKLAYASIGKTLGHYGARFSDIAMERIYTTDMDGLIKCQEVRKNIYGTSLPAATWVEVRRLYDPAALIEIEVELVVD